MANQNLAPLATNYAGVREYIGARYVPVFANPPEWSDTREYEPLTIVLHQGNSYTSAQYVPTGIDISNTEFWMLTGDYNAQVEAYRKEVLAFDGRITENAEGIAGNTQSIEDLEGKVTELENSIRNTVILIGDSFTDTENNPVTSTAWPTRVETTKTIKNYAVSGSSYVRTDDKFLNQLMKANAEVENGTIDKIIIYGGVNDYTNMLAGNVTREEVFEQIKACEDYINNNMGKVNHVFCLTNIGLSSLATYNEYMRFVGYLAVQARMAGIPFIETWDWLIPYNNVAYSSDNLHPSGSGHNILASFMEAIINDLPLPVPYFTLYNVYNDTTVVSSGGTGSASMVIHYANIWCEGSKIHGYVSASITAEAGSGYSFSLFPNNNKLTMGSLKTYHPCPVNVYNLLRNCFWQINGTIQFAVNENMNNQTIVFEW